MALLQTGKGAPANELRFEGAMKALILALGLGESGEAAGRLLDSSDIDGRRRAETLSLAEWAQIYHSWRQRPGAGSSPSAWDTRQGG